MNRPMLKLSLFLLVFVFPLTAGAQSTLATLSGSVTDASGAVLPGAKVEAKNDSTNIVRTVNSDSEGRYTISQLNPSSYQVTVIAVGFSKKVLTGIVLAVSQNAHLDVSLSVGEVSQVVTVQSQAAVTEVESASTGAVIDGVKMAGLPLNQRTFYSLPLLSPAAQQPAQASNSGFRGGFNVVGNNESKNTYTVNGLDDTNQEVGEPSFRPSIEGIQEFKLLTGVYQAEFGRTSGGQIVIATKSGGNAYHGEGFEFIRNSRTDAKNFFTPLGQSLGFRRNQYGFTFGGPVDIPHVYNGHNRTFFFINTEAMGLLQQVSLLTTVPSAAMHNGDFRELLNLPPATAGGPATVIHVVRPDTHTDFTTPNVIDPSYLNTYLNIGALEAALYPLPNNSNPDTSSGPASNYSFNEGRVENLKQASIRLDHQFNNKNSVMLMYNYFNDPSFEPNNSLCGSPTIPNFGCHVGLHSPLAMATYTHIFTPNMVNDVRIGWTQTLQPRTNEEAKFTTFPHLPNSSTDNSILDTGPQGNNGNIQATVSGFANLSGTTPQGHLDNQYQVNDGLSWTRGAHTFKWGGEIRYNLSTDWFFNSGRGGLAFNDSSIPKSATSYYTGNSFSDLLTGYPYTTTLNPYWPRFYPRQISMGYFGQDDWKVTRYITMNLGLRWDFNSPVRSKNGALSSFNPATGLVDTPTQSCTLVGTPVTVSCISNTHGEEFYHKDLNNFGPRVGIAWQPFKKETTVVHAGGAILYSNPTLLNGFLTAYQQFPVRFPQTFTTKAGSPLTFNDCTKTGGVNCDYPAANNASSVAPQGIDPNFATMYVSEWTFGIQRQITSSTSLDVSYFGDKGSKIESDANYNQAVPNYNAATNTYTSCTLCRPFPTFGNVLYIKTSGNGEYESLQVKLNKIYKNGFTYLLAYTYAKSMDNTPGFSSASNSSSATPQNSLNKDGDYGEHGLSDFNVKHRLVISPVYELPFGRGKSMLTSGWGSAIAGGWQLSGIIQVQTGRPFSVNNTNNNNSFSFNSGDRPNITGDPNQGGAKTISQWFNTKVFAAPQAGTFGDEHRNTVIGPGYVDADVALQRTFSVYESLQLQFRGESFNVFNHPNFYNPLGTGTGAFGTGAFGQLTQAYDAREDQIGVKLLF